MQYIPGFDRAVKADELRRLREAQAKAEMQKRLQDAAPDLLREFKLLLDYWWHGIQKCDKPDCLVCKESKAEKKRFDDLIAQIEKGA